MYVRNALPTSNNGAVCSPALNFRRVMMNRHAPAALVYRNIYLTDLQTNRTSYVYFQVRAARKTFLERRNRKDKALGFWVGEGVVRSEATHCILLQAALTPCKRVEG